MKRLIRIIALVLAVSIAAVMVADHFGAVSVIVNGQALHGPVLAIAAGSTAGAVLLVLSLLFLLLSAVLWGMSVVLAVVLVAVGFAFIAAGLSLFAPVFILVAAAGVVLAALARKQSAV